jgi:hypothetical protein
LRQRLQPSQERFSIHRHHIHEQLPRVRQSLPPRSLTLSRPFIVLDVHGSRNPDWNDLKKAEEGAGLAARKKLQRIDLCRSGDQATIYQSQYEQARCYHGNDKRVQVAACAERPELDSQ